jgi:hypothetical protein
MGWQIKFMSEPRHRYPCRLIIRSIGARGSDDDDDWVELARGAGDMHKLWFSLISCSNCCYCYNTVRYCSPLAELAFRTVGIINQLKSQFDMYN